jgi:hypothetical protein
LAALPADVNDAERLRHGPAMGWIVRSKTSRAKISYTYSGNEPSLE